MISPIKARFKVLLVVATVPSLGFDNLIGQIFNPLYEAHGVLAYRQISPSNTVLLEQIWTFAMVEGDDGSWKMQLDTQFPNPDLPARSTEIIAFDKTNIYSVVYSPDRLVLVKGKPTLVRDDPSVRKHPAMVCAGPYPVDHSSSAGLIWLAFVGGRYLDLRKQSSQFPNLTVTDARNDPIAWACDFDYEMLSAGPRPLISFGRYRLNPGRVFESSLDYPELDEPVDKKALGRMERVLGFYRQLAGDLLVGSTYQLVASNTLNGVLIPERFRCNVVAIGNTNYHGTLEGLVTNLIDHPSTNLMPSLIGGTTVGRAISFL